MTNILLLSRVNTTNLGDQLIGRSMMKLFSPFGNVVQGDLFYSRHVKAIRVESQNTEKGPIHNDPYESKKGLRGMLGFFLRIAFVKYLRWLKRNRSVFKVIVHNKFDFIIIGGGEIMSSSFAFALSLWAIMLSLFQRKAKVVLFGVGVTDAYKKDINRINRLVRRSDMIFVRDAASRCKMEKLYNRDSIEIPDVAFVNDFHQQGAKQGVLFGVTTMKRLLKHGYLYSSVVDYYNHLITEITNLQDEGYDVRLSYTSQEDFKACARFSDYYSKQRGREVELVGVKTLDDLIRVTQKASIVVSPRMHGCIIGQLSGAEVRPEIISEKMLSYKNKYLDSFDCQEARIILMNDAKTVVAK